MYRIEAHPSLWRPFTGTYPIAMPNLLPYGWQLGRFCPTSTGKQGRGRDRASLGKTMHRVLEHGEDMGEYYAYGETGIELRAASLGSPCGEGFLCSSESYCAPPESAGGRVP